jgi:hypothetical protein
MITIKLDFKLVLKEIYFDYRVFHFPQSSVCVTGNVCITAAGDCMPQHAEIEGFGEMHAEPCSQGYWQG